MDLERYWWGSPAEMRVFVNLVLIQLGPRMCSKVSSLLSRSVPSIGNKSA